MASSSVAENWACMINGDDEFDRFEVPEIDTALLMSLLEESQVDQDCDDERLTSVIRSLEAEIEFDPNMMDGQDDHHLPLQPHHQRDGNLKGCQPSDGAQVDGGDCSDPHDDLDFNWMDVEMAPSSPSDDIANWYMDPYGGEMERIIEFIDQARDYSHTSYGVPLEEHSGAYGYLWQETHTSVMYG
ncbi:unnamed protein product [Camellia sinensis]